MVSERALTDDVARAAIDLPVTPLEVWRLLVDRSAWWPELAFDAVSGSPLRETWTEDGRTFEALGRVVAVDPPRHLSFEWTEPGWSALLTVAITVEPAAAGAAVTVTEQGFIRIGAEEGLRLEHEAGWQQHLVRLRGASIEAARSRRGPQR